MRMRDGIAAALRGFTPRPSTRPSFAEELAIQRERVERPPAARLEAEAPGA